MAEYALVALLVLGVLFWYLLLWWMLFGWNEWAVRKMLRKAGLR